MNFKKIALGAALAMLTVGTLQAKTYTRDEFRIRDPFVLPDGDTYYLYESKPWSGGNGVAVRTSKDLETWSEKEQVMTVPEGVPCTAVWAPEVHRYDGKYWLFTTLTMPPDPAKPIRPMLEAGFKGGLLQPRGVWVFRSDSPKGPFVPVKMGSVTPPDWMCLDGTLWVEDGTPWMVFCHEWCQTGNGRMMAAPLAKDLSRFAAEPIELFQAAFRKGAGAVTDGPFLYREPKMGLRMIWSNMLKDSGYCVIMCQSKTGKIAGPWQKFTPLFKGDGGHGMLFKRFDGQLMLTLHQPNHGTLERMKLFPIGTSWEGLARIDWNPFGPEWQKQWSPKREQEIDARIEKHRKANGRFKVAAPAGTEVRVDQVASKFLFGSNLFNFDQLGSDAMNAEYRAAFTNLFNAATIAFYWKDLEPEEGKFRFRSGARDLPGFWNAFDFKNDDPYKYVEWRRPAPDRLIDFCRQNGVAIHGHTILYVAWSPDWMWKKATTPEIAGDLFTRHVAAMAKQYGDTVPQWDIVNESLNRNSTKAAPDDADNWYSKVRPVTLPKDFTLQAFKTAEQGFPQSVRLAINDAWTIANDAYPDFIRKLIREGAKIDVIGFQKHIFRPANLLTIASGYPCLTNSQTWDLDEDAKRLAELDKIGKPLHISEITIPSPRGLAGLSDDEADEIQAKVMRAYYRFWFSWPSVERITYWNLVDGVGAKNERMSSGWFNRDMTRKRVWHVMNDLINREWRTRLTAKVGDDGRVNFRGFKGTYRLTWKDADGREHGKTVEVK